MNNIKLQRLESDILTIVNRTIVTEVNDKAAKFGRATYVKLSADLSLAKVYIDCFDRTKITQTLNALNKMSGLFRSKIATALNTFKTPKISFEIDKTIDYAQNIDKIIDIINKEKK